MKIEMPMNGDLVLSHGYVGQVTATSNASRVVKVRWLTHWIGNYAGKEVVYAFRNMIEHDFSFVRPEKNV